jgi:hypothetical protein
MSERVSRWVVLQRAFIAVLLALAVVGCTVQLAPNYEEPIVQGLNDFNVAIQAHMAAAAKGTQPGLTADQQKAYDDLEGRGRALIMLIKARPEPKPAFLRWFGWQLSDDIPASGNTSYIDFLDVPTDDQIERILEQLVTMEDEDRRQGLARGQYKLYANAIDLFMRNALTYEMALKR